jgi:hypothetical protein
MTCDNRESEAPASCAYTEEVGTEWGTTETESMSVSAKVEASVSAGFFGLFAASAPASASTQFDWSIVDNTVKSKLTRYEVSVEVPPGKMLYIEHVVGRCGGSSVQTNMFKTYTEGKNNTREEEEGYQVVGTQDGTRSRIQDCKRRL